MSAQGEATKPIRVLWLIKGLGPGGAEQLLASSARVADHHTFRFETAYVRPDKTQLVPALEGAGVSTHLLGEGRRHWLVDLRELMQRFDVVHSHSPLLASAARLMSRTIPTSRRPVLVSTEHNVWGNFSWPTRLLNAATCALDAQRWSVSGEVERSMWGPLGQGAPVLIHGIVHDADARVATRADTRRALGLGPDDVVAITVANLRREKDYPNLLRAADLATRKCPQLRVLAVGQGPLLGEIERLHAELGLGDRLRLLGYRQDVADLLAASDLFVLGSAFEGLPVSIMEAMAAGLPVVATAVGGVPEAVEDGTTGRLVPAHDHEALAAALEVLATSPGTRARMGQAARARSARFDIRSAVAVEQDAYRRLVLAAR